MVHRCWAGVLFYYNSENFPETGSFCRWWDASFFPLFFFGGPGTSARSHFVPTLLWSCSLVLSFFLFLTLSLSLLSVPPSPVSPFCHVTAFYIPFNGWPTECPLVVTFMSRTPGKPFSFQFGIQNVSSSASAFFHFVLKIVHWGGRVALFKCPRVVKSFIKELSFVPSFQLYKRVVDD